MVVFRIAKQSYIQDLSGSGAALAGGRWNYKGERLLYTSTSKSLAALEFLVHQTLANIPENICFGLIQIEDNASREIVPLSSLPTNWEKHPPLSLTMEIGSQWLNAKKTLLLQVPSAVMDTEFNVLINPNHPEMSKVKFLSFAPWDVIIRFF